MDSLGSIQVAQQIVASSRPLNNQRYLPTFSRHKPITIGAVTGYSERSWGDIAVSMLWQGGQLGCGGGAVLGALYIVGGASIAILSSGLQVQGAPSILELLGAVVMFMLSAGFVSLIGAIAGTLVGVLNGLVLSIPTTLIFAPLHHPRIYRITITVLAFIFNLGIAVWITEGGEDTFVFIPSVIGVCFSLYAAQRLARWYAWETAILEYTYHLGTPTMPEGTTPGQGDNQP